jgi:hypothetical protein
VDRHILSRRTGQKRLLFGHEISLLGCVGKPITSSAPLPKPRESRAP